MNPVFLYDFASPNAYFVHRVIPEVEGRLGQRFEYRPVLLGGLFKLSGNQAPMITNAGVPNKMAYDWLEIDRFIARHGLTRFKMNPHFPVNSLNAMRVAVAAEVESGELAEPVVEALFHFMWEDPRNLADPAELARALNDAGLPAERLMALSGDAAVKQKLMDNTADAHTRGAFGLPSFLVGDDLYFGKDRLRDVEEAVAAR